MLSFPPLLLAVALTATGDLELLEFTASWCAPCKAMQPTIDQLRSQGYAIRPIDIDEHRAWPSSSTSLASRHLCWYRDAKCWIELREVPPPNSWQPYSDNIPVHDRRLPRPIRTRGTPPARKSTASASTPGLDAMEQRALQASVRLRVEDGDGHSYGTGTIVDLHGQEALILTCGHIFRESQGRGRILVDLCDGGSAGPVEGQLLRYQLEPDIALVSVHTPSPIQPMKVASPAYRVSSNTEVFSVGCNHGQPPTVMRGRVKQVNKYLGPPNLVTTGRPVDGRSGGGLFSTDGFLIGICNAADPEIDEGLYAAYQAIHQQLDAAKLSFVYQTDRSAPNSDLAAGSKFPVHPASWNHDESQRTNPIPAVGLTDVAGSEVICIVRSPNDPDGQCRVIVLNRAPGELVQRLLEEQQRQKRPQQTEMRIPAAVDTGQRPMIAPQGNLFRTEFHAPTRTAIRSRSRSLVRRSVTMARPDQRTVERRLRDVQDRLNLDGRFQG